jgi:hypothetical protein
MDPIPRSTIDHLADLIAASTTEKLVLVILLLFITLLLSVVVLAWRVLPLIRASNEQRGLIGQALDRQQQALTHQNELIDALRDEMKVLRVVILERRGWLRWFK